MRLEGCRSRLCFQTSAPATSATSVQVDKEAAQRPQAWLKFPQRAPAGPALSSGWLPSPWCVLGRHLGVARPGAASGHLGNRLPFASGLWQPRPGGPRCGLRELRRGGGTPCWPEGQVHPQAWALFPLTWGGRPPAPCQKSNDLGHQLPNRFPVGPPVETGSGRWGRASRHPVQAPRSAASPQPAPTLPPSLCHDDHHVSTAGPHSERQGVTPRQPGPPHRRGA